MSDALKDKRKAADRITERTGIDDSYEVVDQAHEAAFEHLTFELDTDILAEDWLYDAAEVIAAGAAFEQVEYLQKYREGGDVHVASRSYKETHRAIGLSVIKEVLSVGYYEDDLIPAIDGAMRLAAETIKDEILAA